jgi:hypothetical protein
MAARGFSRRAADPRRATIGQQLVHRRYETSHAAFVLCTREVRAMGKLALISILAASLVASIGAGFLQEPQETDRNARRDFMRTKLTFSQAIVEGLSIKNFETINRAATEIRNVTEGEMWLVHDTPEYNRFSDELKVAAEELIRASEELNLEGSALRYFDLTLKCIDCHEYLRRNRL